jgi:uncharacterized iron-regulated protein
VKYFSFICSPASAQSKLFVSNKSTVIMKYIFLAAVMMLLVSSFKPRPAYQIFTGGKAKAVDFDKMMKGIGGADVVFFGENHNNSIGHWLQLQVLKELDEATGKTVIVGAEMFEADAQLVLDEYLQGLIKEDHLKKEGKIWDNYETDYAPIVEFAKENKLPFIATNVPRRYANVVARNGLEGLADLDEMAKAYIAPLPVKVDYELSSYKEISEMMAGHMGPGAGSKNMVDAQAIKDATMAHFISKNWTVGSVFYHLNGSFHSKNHEGIVAFLKQSNPDLNIVTITIADQDSIDELEEANHGQADYVIAVPADMTKTY